MNSFRKYCSSFARIELASIRLARLSLPRTRLARLSLQGLACKPPWHLRMTACIARSAAETYRVMTWSSGRRRVESGADAKNAIR